MKLTEKYVTTTESVYDSCGTVIKTIVTVEKYVEE